MRLSYSKINTYKNCPKKYKYQYIDGIKVPFGKALVFGIFIHQVLEDIEVAIKDAGPEPNLPEIVKPIWVKDKNNSKLTKGLNEQDITDAKKIIQNYIFHLEKDGIPDILGVEEWFNITIEGYNIVGKIDLTQREANGKIHVVDHKTTGKKSIKYLDNDRTQLKLYVVAAMEKYGLDVSEVQASFSLAKCDFDKKTYDFNDKDLEELKQDVVSIAESIKSDSSWDAKTCVLCAWCDFYDMCDEAQSDSTIAARRANVLAERDSA